MMKRVIGIMVIAFFAFAVILAYSRKDELPSIFHKKVHVETEFDSTRSYIEKDFWDWILQGR